MAFSFLGHPPKQKHCKVLYYTHTYAFACFLLHIAQKDENRKNSKVNIMYKSNCKVQSLSPISAVILDGFKIISMKAKLKSYEKI